MLHAGKSTIAGVVFVGETVAGHGGPVAIEEAAPLEVQFVFVLIKAMLPVESHAMTVVVPAGAAFGEVALHCAVHCELPRVHVFQVNLRLMIWPLLSVADHPRHARFHVIEQMTVEDPVALFVGEKFDRRLTHWRHINRVLERRKLALAVQMQRMMHHRVVDESHAHDLTAGHANGAFLLHRLAVERPHITLHVAREPQLHFPYGRGGRQRGGLPRAQGHIRGQWSG